MKKITIADMTLVGEYTAANVSLSFREKTEIARALDKMNVDVIEFAPIANEKADTLLVRTVSTIAKNSVISQRTGYTEESVDVAWNAVSAAAKKRLSVAFPVSPTQMEFFCHMKPKAVLAAIPALIARAKTHTEDVEFSAVDATRAEYGFLTEAISAAIAAGATIITACDTASVMMPHEFADFISKLRADIPALAGVHLGVQCTDNLGVALACADAALRAGADEIKCAVASAYIPSEEKFSTLIKARGDALGLCCALKFSEISRITAQIEWIVNGRKSGMAERNSDAGSISEDEMLDQNASLSDVSAAVRRLGYDLTEEDNAKVFEAFGRIATKKKISQRELDVVVATTALQVPPTYTLISYSVTSSNIMPTTAQIHLEKDGKKLSGVCLGDGPVDAAFLTIEQIIGHHYELDEFRIQAVTEGKEAIGSALVRLRCSGTLYSGNGISTDIVGASIRAYLNALNKIVYEEH